MSLKSLDGDYVKCSRAYIADWMKKYNAEGYHIPEEALDEMILEGGEGLCMLEKTFQNLIACAQQDGVETIDLDYVKKVLK